MASYMTRQSAACAFAVVDRLRLRGLITMFSNQSVAHTASICRLNIIHGLIEPTSIEFVSFISTCGSAAFEVF